jgi:hypothetical protein
MHYVVGYLVVSLVAAVLFQPFCVMAKSDESAIHGDLE